MSLPERRGIGKELEGAPEVHKAAELLFKMFGELKKGSRLPDKTSELLNEFGLYASYQGNPLLIAKKWDETGYYWKDGLADLILSEPSRTNKYSADSPIMRSDWVEEAGEIITVTDSHHKLGWGSDNSVVLAISEYGGKGWVYDKHQDKRLVRPWELDSWEGVSELLTKKPREGDYGTRYDFWQLYLRPSYFLNASFISSGMSMLELLTELGKEPGM